MQPEAVQRVLQERGGHAGRAAALLRSVANPQEKMLDHTLGTSSTANQMNQSAEPLTARTGAQQQQKQEQAIHIATSDNTTSSGFLGASAPSSSEKGSAGVLLLDESGLPIMPDLHMAPPYPAAYAPPPLRRSSPVGRVGSDDEENTFSRYFEGEEIQFTNWFEKLLFQHVPIGPNRNQEDLSMNRNSIEHLYNRWFPALRLNTYGVDLCEMSTEALSLLEPIQQSQWPMLKKGPYFH